MKSSVHKEQSPEPKLENRKSDSDKEELSTTAKEKAQRLEADRKRRKAARKRKAKKDWWSFATVVLACCCLLSLCALSVMVIKAGMKTG